MARPPCSCTEGRDPAPRPTPGGCSTRTDTGSCSSTSGGVDAAFRVPPNPTPISRKTRPCIFSPTSSSSGSTWGSIAGWCGTTLGLAYAESQPEAVTELLLSSVVTTSHAEVDWITRSMGRIFPEAWQAFVEGLPPSERDGNLALAYHRLLMNPDPTIHDAAALAWCTWEDVHVSTATGFVPLLSGKDPSFRLMFARLVTHYWGHGAFLEEGQLLRQAERLAGIPTFMTHGRRDISGPADIAVALAAAIPGAEFFIAEEAGHGGPAMTDWMISVTHRLAP